MIDSGNASICPKGKYLLIDNLSNGFDLYNIPRTSPTHSLIIPTKRLYTKQGVFTKNGAQIACGSDHGKVYLYDTQQAERLQVLRHTTGTDIVFPQDLIADGFQRISWSSPWRLSHVQKAISLRLGRQTTIAQISVYGQCL
jgi:hypothetical protein